MVRNREFRPRQFLYHHAERLIQSGQFLFILCESWSTNYFPKGLTHLFSQIIVTSSLEVTFPDIRFLNSVIQVQAFLLLPQVRSIDYYPVCIRFHRRGLLSLLDGQPA